MVKVLIVDDSIFICKAISRILEKDPDVQVVGFAHDGSEAIEKVRELDPDLVTLDVEMPKMNGIEALKVIMRDYPRPVIMISSLTKEGAKVTLEAMSLGAVDFIPKELYQSGTVGINLEKIEKQLLEKIKLIGAKRQTISSNPTMVVHSTPSSSVREAQKESSVEEGKRSIIPTLRKGQVDIVVIGVSTGGPTSLQKVIAQLPRDFPVPGIIIQHMPPAFTGPLAGRLNSLGGPCVKEAQQGEKLEPGKFLVVPGAYHMELRKVGSLVTVVLKEEPKDALYHPSIDITISSAADVFKSKTLAVILTGMGRDGLEGVKKVKQYGGKVIAQDEATSVVFGMPKVVIDAGLADKIVPLDRVAETILKML